MDRSIPTTNKYLQQKWQEQFRRIHVEQLKGIRGKLNLSCPPNYEHIKKKAKRDQLLEDRFTEIERENRLLLEKMTGSMNTSIPSKEPYKKKSLNREARKREYHSITLENAALLNRLKNKKSAYSLNKWEAERRVQEQRLHSICEYPYQLGQTTGKRNRKYRKSSTPLSHRFSYALSLAFKKYVTIGGSNFLIEINKNARTVIIHANNSEMPETFKLQLEKQEALKLMGGSEDYQKLVSLLRLEKDELVLINPEYEE